MQVQNIVKDGVESRFESRFEKLLLPEYSTLLGEYNKILSRCVFEIPPVILGDIKFVPIVFHFTRELKTGQTKFHQHKFCEFSLMFFGGMDYYFDGAKCHISREDKSMVLIPAGLAHDRITSVAPVFIAGFMLDIVALNNDGEKLLPKIKSTIKKTDFHFAIPEKMFGFRECLMEELKTRPPFFTNKITLLLHNFLFETFREYFGHLLWSKRSSDEKQIVYDRISLVYLIKTFVEENLSSPFSVMEVAEHFHLCKRHLNRIFTDQTGIPLGKYIITRKMGTAKKMLLKPNTIVKEVAYSLGFTRCSYFSRLFKRVVGVSPSEYRSKKILQIASSPESVIDSRF